MISISQPVNLCKKEVG